MKLLERIETITALWTLVVPSIPNPPASWISRWCVYRDQDIERGVMRASKKFAADRVPRTPDPEIVYAYVCGVARNEYEGKRGRYA